MKKKLVVVALCLTTTLLFGCGKSKKDNTENNTDTAEATTVHVNPEAIESQKNDDITMAKTIKTAVETALGNESIYIELTTKHTNQLISVTEQGLSVLEQQTKGEILNNIGANIPEANYTELDANHFAFSVDDKGMVTVYVCNANNSTKWMLAPEIDMEYGGTVNTDLIGVDQTGGMVDTDIELESAQKSNDVSTAKTIKTAVETALGNEDMYIELTENHAGELIIATEKGMSVLEEDTKNEIIANMGTVGEVMYTANGADHFAFIVDDKGIVTVYVCNEDNSRKWSLCPVLDVEYGGEEPTIEDVEQMEDEMLEE